MEFDEPSEFNTSAPELLEAKLESKAVTLDDVYNHPMIAELRWQLVELAKSAEEES